MTDNVQRLVRKLQPKGPRSFDEQTWPIYVAIVVLSGYLCGVVISVFQFTDPRLHANAITWLVAVFLLGLLALFCVTYLQNSIVRRTLVLSLLLSLIVNLSVIVLLAWTSIFTSPWNETESTSVVETKKEDVIVPEYPLFNDKQQQRVPQEYERPVETGEPEAEKRIELTRQSTQPDHALSELNASASSSTRQVQTTSKPNPRRLAFDATTKRNAGQTQSTSVAS